MLAVDGKKASDIAAKFLLRLLKEGDILFIVFVQPEPGFLEELSSRQEYLDARKKQVDELSKQYLAQFKDKKLDELRFDHYVGDPRESIQGKAEERQIDILVVGHRDLGVLERLVLGSVSEYLVKNCTCSVLVC